MGFTVLNRFFSLNYKYHIVFAALLRIIFILYGIYHDRISSVSYTDIDYKVFTDAARSILNHKSPYDRHTYRYSPLIAFAVIPNVMLHYTFGKFLFSLVDLIVGLLIRSIVKVTYREYENYKANVNENVKPHVNSLVGLRPRRRSRNVNRIDEHLIGQKSELDYIADMSMLFWLYNPITIAIATRGNCDSIAGLIVLFTLYFVQCKKKYFLAGIMHGLSIHFRLYPICYSLTLYMHLSNYSYYSASRFSINSEKSKQKELKANENQTLQNLNVNLANTTKKQTIFKREYVFYLLPNYNQIQLVTGCIISLSLLTATFYYFYGYKFLFESYIYHFIRKDTRHNFSVYFYLQYLTAGVINIGLWQSVLILLPQMVLLLVFSFRYGLNKLSLNFAILTQTITMITYNTVLTSQYFIWILVVMPLCIWQINMTKKTALFLLFIWFAAQAAWLLPAYYLEFKGQNTFLFIWMQSVSYFSTHIAILGRLIMKYMPLKQNID